MTDGNPENDIVDPNFRKLKEFVGHTPFEVIGGAILGIILAFVIPIV
ncbi:MAG: divergent PAP2 family protein [Oscillospiraceae bacterium]